MAEDFHFNEYVFGFHQPSDRGTGGIAEHWCEVGTETRISYSQYATGTRGKSGGTAAKKNVRYCKKCFTLTDQEICPICSDPKRDQKTIMVVEDTRDLAAYEKTGQYNGLYHVLQGAINPSLGITPADIRLKELMQRLQTEDVEEVIIATNSSLEGEATAMYISKLLKPVGIKVTRIASGVPVGGDLEYIDEVTLFRALQGRTEL